MTLDELIEKLLEAKEHCVDGRSEVLVSNGSILNLRIDEIEYNSTNVIITIS